MTRYNARRRPWPTTGQTVSGRWVALILVALILVLSATCRPNDESSTPTPGAAAGAHAATATSAAPSSATTSHSAPANSTTPQVVPPEAASATATSSGVAPTEIASHKSVAPNQTATPLESLSAVARQADRGILADELAHGDQRGDWDTEAFHEETKQRLQVLERAITGGVADQLTELRDLLTDDFQGGVLRPDEATLAIAWRDAQLVVRRPRTELSSPLRAVNAADLDQLIAPLTNGFRDRGDIELHTKIFRVQTAGTTGSTELYVDTDGAAAEAGGLQQNMTWRCQWQLRADNVWQLKSLEPLAFEEVRYQAAEGRLFTDCTASILAGDTQLAAQLAPGINHWRLNLAQSLGVDAGGLVGVNVADVNGDGLDDLYFCEIGGLPNRLLLQQPDGTTRDISAEAGVDWLDRAHGALFADWDNDGDQDLAVSVGPWLLMLANDGQAHFTLARQLRPHPTAYSLAAADYDLDGRLDLYVCSYGNDYETFADSVAPLPFHDANNGVANTLYRNEGEWQFRDVTVEVGLDENNRRFSFAASWEDFDNDGDPDLYVANDFGRNNLYVNQVRETGRFDDQAAEQGVEDLGSGMSACWGDYNNDGQIDLYVGNMFSSAGNRITFQDRFRPGVDSSLTEQYRRFARGNSLFANSGNGPFRDVSESAGVTLGRWAWSSLFADLNNDGWQDLMVTNGHITGVEPDDL